MKTLKLFIIMSLFFLLVSCQRWEQKKEVGDELEKMIWKEEPHFVISVEEAKSEIKQKMLRLKKFLAEQNLEGMLFTQVRNVNWITAGLVNTQIVLNKDVGAASLLVMKDGKKYLICNGSEAGRLMDEDLKNLGYELKLYNWYESNPVKDVRGNIIKEITGNTRIGSDIDFPGTVLVADVFKPVRYSLTDTEIKRYRWLGELTTEAVVEVCKRIKQGMNEFEIEAMTSAELRSRGILPTVLLIGVDERIFKYRHALPGGAEVKNYAMVNVVAEKWGMPIAVTRFVHFGNLPEELQTKLEKTAIVNAYYEASTKAGTVITQIWDECKKWYANVGYPDEWMKHHQGGSIGYDDREYVMYPDNMNKVQDRQAFAWNPTITGAKVEETIIAYQDSIEVITKCKDWPMINIELNGKIYPQPGILLKDADTGEIIQQEIKTIKP
ncbi:MAG: M24 family metallopeptidase [Ignavibacteria bacterium]|nr:M24 family metallopeptidase [Ignavibacteria bacterium]